MRFKRDLTITRIHLKTIGPIAYIPIAMLFLFLPLINLLAGIKYGREPALYENIINFAQLFLPFLSSWWIIMILREYVEGKGNELLFLYQGKSKLRFVLYLLAFYLCLTGVLFLVYTILFPNMALEWVRIAAACVFFCGLAYLLIFLSHSIALTLFPLLFYLFISLAYKMRQGENATFFLFFMSTRYASAHTLVSQSLPIFLLGILFFLLGHLLNKRLLKFN